MPDAVMIEFGNAMNEELYDQVNDRVNPGGNPPAGLIFHSAGPGPNGWRIVDVWDSRATFDAFMSEKVGPAVAEIAGADAMSSPPEITSWPVHNHNTGNG